MAKKTAILSIRVLSDTKGAQKGAQDTATAFEKFEKRLDKASKVAAVGGAALVALGKKSIDAASRLEQSSGAVEAVFKKDAETITRFAEAAWKNVGLAQAEAQEMATILGAQLKNLGMPMEQVADQTLDLIDLGNDLAATYGGTTADAVSALSSLLRGERDPIEKYGVGIKQADINAKKLALGLDGLTGEAEKQAEITATLALLYEQTADAQGQAAREFESVEAATQRANAAWENTIANLGTALLPLAAKLADSLAGLSRWVQENQQVVQKLAVGLGVAAAAILSTNAAIKAWKLGTTIVKGFKTAATTATHFVAGMKDARAAASAFTGTAGSLGGKLTAWAKGLKTSTVATKAASAAQWLWNAAMNANPIVWIITAIVAAIALLILNWDKVRPVAEAVWEAIKVAALWVWDNVLKPIADWFMTVFAPVWETVKTIALAVWDGIKAAAMWVWDKVLKPLAAFIVGVFAVHFKVMSKIAEAAWNVIKTAAMWLWDNVLKPIGKWIAETFVKHWNAAKKAGELTWEALRTAGLWLWNNVLKPIGQWITGTFVKHWNALKSVGAAAWNGIKTPAMWLWNNLLKPVGTFVSGTLVNAWNKMKNVGAAAFDALIWPIRVLIGWLETAWSWVSSVINAISNIGGSILGFSAAEEPAPVTAALGPGKIAFASPQRSTPAAAVTNVTINLPQYVGDRDELLQWLQAALKRSQQETERIIFA